MHSARDTNNTAEEIAKRSFYLILNVLCSVVALGRSSTSVIDSSLPFLLREISDIFSFVVSCGSIRSGLRSRKIYRYSNNLQYRRCRISYQVFC